MKAILFGLCIICTPIVVLGAPDYEYVPLVGIPGVEPGSGIEPYLNALYVIAISAAAFLAVGKLLLAGVQYILSDIVTKKENAKKDIRGALVGLLIVVSAVFILTIINPQLINLEALSGIKGIKVVPQQRAELVCSGKLVTDPYTGTQACSDADPATGECDTSLAGPFCGCGETVTYLSTEPGYRCDRTHTTNDSGGETNDETNCDKSQAGPFCGCGEKITYTSTEPGYQCDAI